MMLVEQTSVPASVLPLAEFRDHLKLGTGFSDDAVQDGLLEANLRAALAAVENRTGKAVLERGFVWSISAWRDLSHQVLPVAPVASIDLLQIIDLDGVAEVAAPTSYGLQRDAHRPALVSRTICLPSIPVGGRAEIEFTAGYGLGWSDIPADLAQAVLGIAAYFYENRSTHGVDATNLPTALLGVLAPYRNIRLFGRG
ncbi:MAG: hypothetical protein AAFN59_11245 [Pseudomonadota bacterium]